MSGIRCAKKSTEKSKSDLEFNKHQIFIILYITTVFKDLTEDFSLKGIVTLMFSEAYIAKCDFTFVLILPFYFTCMLLFW